MLDGCMVRLSGLQYYNMGHNCQEINLYGVRMTIMGNIHAEGLLVHPCL